MDIKKGQTLVIARHAYFEVKDKEVVCLSEKYGYWVKISKECYNMVQNAVKEGLSIDEFVALFVDEEDRVYISKLISKLQEAHVLISNGENDDNITLEHVDIMMTERCNLSCKHCGASAVKVNDEEYFDTLEMKSILDKVISCKPKVIVFTGGEPLLREDIFELLGYVKSKGDIQINLMTNGTLINENNVKDIVESINSIDISMDGYDEESCSYVRGKGVFNNVCNSIMLLREVSDIPISLSMVSLNQSATEEFKFKELCKQLNVKSAIRRLSYSGRAKENWKYLNSKEQENTILPENFKRENPTYQELKGELKACTCKGGVSSFSIDSTGKIYPCAAFSEITSEIGNIKDIDDLAKFLNSEELENSKGMKTLMDYSPYGNKICKECDVRYFCWTCPHIAYEIASDKELLKKTCNGKKEYLRRLVWGTSF